MARIRDLGNAPITEALFDFRASLPGGFDPKRFLGMENRLSATYPKHEPLRAFAGRFGIEAGRLVSVAQDKGIQGHVFKSADDKDIGQFRVDGMTYNRLKPYTSWEHVLGQARFLWELYSQTCHPEALHRIAVRYINHISVALPISDLRRYLTNPPSIPPGVPQTVRGFLSRVIIDDPERGLSANLIQALERRIESNSATIIVDIDVYKDGDFELKEMESVWAIFSSMRELKNLIFFNSVTEETVEKYQ